MTRQLFTSICILTNQHQHASTMSQWRIITHHRQKHTASLQEIARLDCWSGQTSRSISGVCAPGTLVEPGTGRAPSPRNEFAMVFQEQSKTSILTPQTMQVLCYPLTQGHLDYRFDMVIVGATLLEAQVHSFRFQKQEFSQILTNMYKQMRRNRSILDWNCD